MARLGLALALVLAGATGAVGARAAELREGLVFYVPFEQGTDAAVASGARRAIHPPAADADGRVGKGLALDGKATLRYNAAGNIETERGTMAFWVRPGWSADGVASSYELLRAEHLNLAYTPNSKALFFMTGATLPEKGFAWNYSLASKAVNNWAKDSWHHVAASWDRTLGVKTLYLDGEKAGEAKTTVFPERLSGTAVLEAGKGAPGRYDEIAVWNRVLTDAEVSRLAMTPEAVARELAPDAAPASAAAAASVEALPDAEAKAIKDAVAFYAPLDEGLAPLASGGSYLAKSATGTAFVPGVAGGALSASGRVEFDSRGVVDPAVGAATFWFRPGPGFAERKENVSLWRAGHLNLSLLTNALSFMTGRTVDGKFGWDYACGTDAVKRWKPGEWRHLAVVWNRAAGTKSLYLDGRLAKSATTDRFPEKIDPAGEFLFAGAPGDYDELAVWNRELDALEVARLAAQPDRLRRVFGLPSPATPAPLPPTAEAARERIAKDVPAEEALAFDVPVVDPPERSVVKPGEAFTTVIAVANKGLATRRGTLTVTLRDFWMNARGTETIPFELAGGARTEWKRDYSVDRRGAYKVEVVCRTAAAPGAPEPEPLVRDVASFACWEVRQPPNPDGFFGNHVNSWAGGKYLRQAAKLGQNWMRNHNMLQAVWWEKVEPEPGNWAWNDADAIATTEALGMPVLGQLFTTPNWAAAGGPVPPPATKGYNQCLKPDSALFERYVMETVKHYGVDRGARGIKYWEIWNEPGVSMFWKGTPEEFAEVVKVAVAAVRKADPEATVMAAGYTRPARVWQRRAAAAGAFKGLDAISFHAYASLNKPLEAELEGLRSTIDHFQSLAVNHGDGKPLPLWNTEGGIGSTTFLRGVDFPLFAPEGKREPMNWREAALGMPKHEALLRSEGLVKSFHYFQNPSHRQTSHGYANLSSLDINDAPKPFIVARAALQEQTDYMEFAARIRNVDARLWAFVFKDPKRPDQSRIMAFAGPEGECDLVVAWPGDVVRRVDLMGNDLPVDRRPQRLRLTEEPEYLHVNAPAAAVSAALEAAFNRPASGGAPGFVVVKASPPYRVDEADAGHKVPALPDFAAPAEAPDKVFTLEMRPFVTMGLADDKAGDGKGGWADEGDMNDLRDFKPGRRVFYGVPFDVIDPATNGGKSVATLKSRNLTPTLPEQVGPVPVARKVRTLYFLHAAAWGTPGDIGDYIVKYADGTTATATMTIPLNINNWWNGPDAGEQSLPVPVKVTNTLTGEPAWRYLRVWEWQNPKMDVPVESVILRSRGGGQTPITLAISGVAF